VKSLARPGGNVTGLYLQQLDLAKKRVVLLTQALPSVQAATVFWDSVSEDQWKATSISSMSCSSARDGDRICVGSIVLYSFGSIVAALASLTP
jgi:hypothetical protein